MHEERVRGSIDADAIAKDWRAVGGYLGQSLSQTAKEIGGDDLSIKVKALIGAEVLPDLGAFELLESFKPGITQEVLERAAIIQKVKHEQEVVQLNNLRSIIKSYGREIMNLFNPSQNT